MLLTFMESLINFASWPICDGSAGCPGDVRSARPFVSTGEELVLAFHRTWVVWRLTANAGPGVRRQSERRAVVLAGRDIMVDGAEGIEVAGELAGAAEEIIYRYIPCMPPPEI